MENPMSRFALLPLVLLVALLGAVALLLSAATSQPATASAPIVSALPRAQAGTGADTLPAATCDYTPLSFNLTSGVGPFEAMRPFSVAADDTFEQFIAPPITATAASTASVILNNGFTGAVTGGITGTFVLTNLNGLLVTAPSGLSTPRGFEVNELVIQGASGTITAVVAINFFSVSSSPPYYPRGFLGGYIHSIATSGAYAPYKFNGVVTFGLITPGGPLGLTLTANIVGRLYTGGGSLNELVTAARSAPSNSPLTLQPADIIAQFRSLDFSVGAVAPAHVNPRAAFAGTVLGTINGGFVMDHNSLIVDGGPNSGKGWLAGEFTFSDTGGNILTGPWLTDRNGTSVSGFVWQALGTGIYTDSLLFGTINGTLLAGGTTLAGTMTGTYCDGSQIPTPTVVATTTGSPVASPTRTSTSIIPTNTPTRTGSPTGTSIPTLTGTPTTGATLTGTPTTGATLTGTPPPSITSTTTPTATTATTATPTRPVTSTTTPTQPVIPTITSTPCVSAFTDVLPSDYFYEAVRYLYCHGAISGYGDNTFRPYNLTTRGQLAKIVVLAKGWTIYTPPAPTFQDVPTTDPFYTYIETAYNHGIISGYGCGAGCLEYRPGNNITRGQLCKIIVLAQAWAIYTPPTPTFTDVAPADTFFSYIETAYSHNVISGYDCGPSPEGAPYCLEFRPGNNATRGQISKIVYNAVVSGQ
jgi:hypothetical protein